MNREKISCPLCSSLDYSLWAVENGFECVRCKQCYLLYVNPRPSKSTIEQAVVNGLHQIDDFGKVNVRAHRVKHKVFSSKRLLKHFFGDIFTGSTPFSWLDVGAGYGELVEALLEIAPPGSKIDGIEPMIHKVRYAQSLGLPVKTGYVNEVVGRYDFISMIDIFSHIPDFKLFLNEIKKVLNSEGQVLIKTGNAADIGHRRFFPGPLTLPDHLVFAGKSQIFRYLAEAGFEITSFKEERIDGPLYCIKNFVKWMLGKPVFLTFPYQSPTRNLFVRAKLKKF